MTTAVLAVGPVDLDDLDAGTGEESGQPGAIGHRFLPRPPFRPDPNPASQESRARVAIGMWPRRTLVASRPPTSSRDRGHMDLAVGIDSSGDCTRTFYDGHGHPFLSLSRVEGWHGRPGKE